MPSLRTLSVLALASATVAVAPAPAHATTASVVGTKVVVESAFRANAFNDASGNIVIGEEGNRSGPSTVTPGPGCTADAGEGYNAVCPAAGIDGIDVRMASTLSGTTWRTWVDLPTAIAGSPGPDKLTGGVNEDVIDGGDGNDIIDGGAHDDDLRGDGGNDTFLQGPAPDGADAISGRAGTDVVDYSQRTGDLRVTLADATANDGDVATSEGDTIFTSVEDVLGGSGNDRITGNGAPNLLDGRAGDDDLIGEDGNDSFPQGSGPNGADAVSGRGGIDVVDYSQRTAALQITMGDALPNDGEAAAAERDNVFSSTENIVGGAGADKITGNAFANRIDGGNGNDDLIGEDGDDRFPQNESPYAFGTPDGADAISGRGGTDTVDYSSRVHAVSVSLDGVQNDGRSGTEKDNVFTSTENVIGGAGGDSLSGSDGPNMLDGGAGGDSIAGRGGNDVESAGWDGGMFWQGSAPDGSDIIGAGGAPAVSRVFYGDRSTAVRVTPDGVANDGDIATAENDRVDPSVGHSDGGAGNDQLFAYEGRNFINGNGGNDHIDAGAGDDELTGGEGADVFPSTPGNDTASGGAGDDTFLQGAVADGTDAMYGDGGIDVVDYSARTAFVRVFINHLAQSGETGENDTIITSIENAIGGSGGSEMRGSATANRLTGGAGGDAIYGNDGNDTLLGLGAADRLEPGGGNDWAQGGAGDDVMLMQDGIPDYETDCGAGADRAYVDPNDPVTSSPGTGSVCETTSTGAPPPS